MEIIWKTVATNKNILMLLNGLNVIVNVNTVILRMIRFRTESDLFEMIPLPLSRLMLVADYLLYHFYDLQSTLVDQVRLQCFFYYDNWFEMISIEIYIQIADMFLK